jgi:molybdopterin biosynthesis enzyme
VPDLRGDDVVLEVDLGRRRVGEGVEPPRALWVESAGRVPRGADLVLAVAEAEDADAGDVEILAQLDIVKETLAGDPLDGTS